MQRRWGELEWHVTWRLKVGIVHWWVNTFPRQIIDAVTEELLGVVISLRFDLSYKRDFVRKFNYYTVEAGSNTYTVTLRVVGGDGKGSLESETVKYCHEYHGPRTRKWLCWRGPAATVNVRPVLSSERAPHINKPANCLTVIKIWS
jgi:hypothetical protein